MQNRNANSQFSFILTVHMELYLYLNQNNRMLISSQNKYAMVCENVQTSE